MARNPIKMPDGNELLDNKGINLIFYYLYLCF